MLGLILAAWETTNLLGARLQGSLSRLPAGAVGGPQGLMHSPEGERRPVSCLPFSSLQGLQLTSGAQDQQRDTLADACLLLAWYKADKC